MIYYSNYLNNLLYLYGLVKQNNNEDLTGNIRYPPASIINDRMNYLLKLYNAHPKATTLDSSTFLSTASIPSQFSLMEPPIPLSNKRKIAEDEKNKDKKRRHKCTSCQKTFARPSSLNIHTLSHTGEKPFACTYKGCGKSFNVKSNMKRHLKIHYKNP